MATSKRVLEIVDTVGWAIDRLVLPLAQKDSNIDIVYHYTDAKPKNTHFNNEVPRHLVVEEFEKDYDIFHFHCLRAGMSCLTNPEILKRIGDRKIIFTIHTEREKDLEDLINSNLKIDAVIAPTKFVFDKMKNKYKTFLIPHCIEIEKFPYIGKLEGTEVGYIGRVVPHKRYKELVGACKGKYRVNGIGYVDDGTYWRSIDNSGNSFNINIAQKDMNEHIKKHFKIFTCLSEPHIETGPLPVLECMALGIPVLTTDVGWARDNASIENVWFVEDNLLNINDGLKVLMESDFVRKRMRHSARKLIEKFNMDWYLSEHRKIYDNN